MSANSSTPSPTSGSRLHDEDDDNDLTAHLDLGFDGAEDLLRVWRQGLRPDPNLTVSEWADQHRWLSSRGAAEPGRYRTARAPYLREIMDALSPSHPAQRITFMKAAQVGVQIDAADAVAKGVKPEALRAKVLADLAARSDAAGIIATAPAAGAKESPIVAAAKKSAAASR